MISRVIKVEVRVISLSIWLWLIALTSILIILDITKSSSNIVYNHSVILDNQALYQNEIGVLYVDWFSRVTWSYRVLWPRRVYFSFGHQTMLGALHGVLWVIYLPKHLNRYITSAHRQNRRQQTNSCTLQKQSYLFIELYYQHYVTD